jgi:hypothetical protein
MWVYGELFDCHNRSTSLSQDNWVNGCGSASIPECSGVARTMLRTSGDRADDGTIKRWQPLTKFTAG